MINDRNGNRMIISCTSDEIRKKSKAGWQRKDYRSGRADRSFFILNPHLKIISIDVAMFNEIYVAVVHPAGFHYPAKRNNVLIMDFSGSRITIANPEYMFNFANIFLMKPSFPS
jgi:hypothetical protein